jgi:hypothetical protein
MNTNKDPFAAEMISLRNDLQKIIHPPRLAAKNACISS